MHEAERRCGPSRLFGLPPRVAAGFGVALLAVVVAGGALSYALAARSARGGAMTRSRSIVHYLHELDAAVVVAATAVDLYAVTGDGAQRLRHERAVAAANAALTRLEAAAGGAPPHAARVDRLGPLLRAVEAQGARLVALRDRGDARADRRSNSGTRTALQQVHDLIDEMETAEEASVRDHEAAWRRTVRLTYLVGAAAVLALLVLIVGAARVVRQDTARRNREDVQRARLLELQQRLMAMVGHDLRTPLSGIAWNAALLARSGLPRAEADLVHRISASAKRMERLIRDVLDYGRVHAGAGIPIAPEPGDLAVICREVVEQIHDAAHPVSLVANGDTTGTWDADRVEQIVANLVANALKYGPAGRPVSVRLHGEPDAVRIEVHDAGGGIPPAVRSRLFEPWRCGDGVEGKGSVGLGLFIVRTLAEAHGGTVSVDSDAERGTTFTVRLPRRVSAVRRSAAVAG